MTAAPRQVTLFVIGSPKFARTPKPVRPTPVKNREPRRPLQPIPVKDLRDAGRRVREGCARDEQSRIRNWHAAMSLAALGRELRSVIRMQRTGIPYLPFVAA
jgi:hypothetical protein